MKIYYVSNFVDVYKFECYFFINTIAMRTLKSLEAKEVTMKIDQLLSSHYNFHIIKLI